jgi:hypothetical protein
LFREGLRHFRLCLLHPDRLFFSLFFAPPQLLC